MQPRGKPSFEWQPLASDSTRNVAPLPPLPALPALPKEAEPVAAPRGNWIFGLFAASGALAYLVLTGDLGSIAVIAAIFALLFSLLVGWGIWITNNVHF